MTTITAEIPDTKKKEVSLYIKKSGGKIIDTNDNLGTETDEDDEATHGVFFGENIRRVIKAFCSK
jgi:hypothetical protein